MNPHDLIKLYADLAAPHSLEIRGKPLLNYLHLLHTNDHKDHSNRDSTPDNRLHDVKPDQILIVDESSVSGDILILQVLQVLLLLSQDLRWELMNLVLITLVQKILKNFLINVFVNKERTLGLALYLLKQNVNKQIDVTEYHELLLQQ